MNSLTYKYKEPLEISLQPIKPSLEDLSKQLDFYIKQKNINGKKIEFFNKSMFEHICNHYDELPDDITVEQIVEFCDVHYFGACFTPI